MATNPDILTLKANLWQQIEAIDLQTALFPIPNPEIDRLISQLEQINPTPHPLHPASQPLLGGEWDLVYASQGTVVTRKFQGIPAWTGIQIQRVWQDLTFESSSQLKASNCAIFSTPVLGKLQIQANGDWFWENTADSTVKVSFAAFCFQAIEVFGLPSVNLPELKIPVLEFLRNQAIWTTSYLA